MSKEISGIDRLKVAQNNKGEKNEDETDEQYFELIKSTENQKKKMKSFAKQTWLTSAAVSAPLDTTMLRSARTSPVVLKLAVPCVI